MRTSDSPIAVGREDSATVPEAGSRHAGELPAGFDHPRGTLAVVGIFGLLFALAWLATYLFVFLERGAPHLHP